MPTDAQLSWAEIRDFAGGLWTVNDQLMPPNAAQVMTDCYPTPGGGLRAWYKPTTFVTTGVANPTNERVRCIFVHENAANGANDNYLLTYNTVDTQCRLYRMNETAGAVVWTNIKTFAAGLDPDNISATAYNTSDGNLYAVFSLGTAAAGGGAGDGGMWSVRFSDGNIVKRTSSSGFTVNYQSRIVTAVGSVLHYTDPGVWTNIDTNLAPVDINEGQPNIMFMAAFSPGDLVVFKEGAPIYLVEGDLFAYTVRQMNGSRPVQVGGPNVVRGPQGLIFRAGSDGVFETPDGSFLSPLSRAISSQSWTLTNPLVWTHHWLMAFGNGLVLDYDSHAWFNFSGITSSGYGFPLRRLAGVFFSDNTAPFTLWKVIPSDGRTDNRAETYTWKSAPLRDPTGRQIEIRAVQVTARSTNTSTSTITVTVNGVSRTIACDSSGRGSITFYFLARRETLDVQVVAASNATGVEAPRIEVVRVGSRGGHFLTTGSDVG